MESNEIEKTPFEFEFRGIDKIILPSFLKLLDSNDIILDFKEENSISVSYSKKALKWLKDVKKKDQFWDEEHFIMRVINSAAKIISKEELESINSTEDQKIEENDVHKSDETPDSTVSN
jgi:hypothetical protein